MRQEHTEALCLCGQRAQVVQHTFPLTHTHICRSPITTRADIHNFFHVKCYRHNPPRLSCAGLPKRLFLGIVPPQPRHITRFDSRAGVELTPVRQEHAEALCTVVNALNVSTYSRRPDWLLVPFNMRYELYIYFTYFIYCVCIASLICIVCVPRSAPGAVVQSIHKEL